MLRRYARLRELDGGAAAIMLRLDQGVWTLLAVLVAVGLSSILAVVFDGDAAAVRVNEWAPLLMLALLGLLVTLLGWPQDLVAGLRRKGSPPQTREAPAANQRAAPPKEPESVDAPSPAHTPRTALFTIEFWLVFGVMSTVCGSNSATGVRSPTFGIHPCLRTDSSAAAAECDLDNHQ